MIGKVRPTARRVVIVGIEAVLALITVAVGFWRRGDYWAGVAAGVGIGALVVMVLWLLGELRAGAVGADCRPRPRRCSAHHFCRSGSSSNGTM